MQIKEKASRILAVLKKTYPDAICTLTYEHPWELLVAGILSAQCTDARVNLITPPLFRRFSSRQAMAKAELVEIEDLIRSCGLYRSKARAIRGSARMIEEEFAGKVPERLEELIRLPGVGRKIANLLLGDAFGQPAIVVDTHCGRVTRRIGFSEQQDPLKVEQDLMAIIPESDWISYGHLMVAHGRELCTARSPACSRCPIQMMCNYGLTQIKGAPDA